MEEAAPISWHWDHEEKSKGTISSEEKELIIQRVKEKVRKILTEGADHQINLKQTGRLPPWYDSKSFTKGQEFFHQNYFTMFVSKLTGLLVLLANPHLVRVLKMTGKSSNKLTAFKRYMGTIRHMLIWYEGGLDDSNSSARKSLMRVRGFHHAASSKASSIGYGHISQRDLALTQFGFMGFGLLKFEKLGLSGTPEQIEGFIHFWRTIGFLLGVTDEYNLCGGSVAETWESCRILLDQIFVPSLLRRDPDFVVMSRALMEGMRVAVPAVDKHAFMGFTHYICDLEYRSLLVTWISKAIFYYHIFSHKLLTTSYLRAFFRPYFNFLLKFGFNIVQKFPSVTFIFFGKRVDWRDEFLRREDSTTLCESK